MRTGNPVLREDTFSARHTAVGQATMTIGGTVNKTFLLTVLLLLSAGWVWSQTMTEGGLEQTVPLIFGGAIAGLVLVLISVFKPAWSAVTAPLYALAEGLFVGGVSALLELQFPGIVLQAVGLTVATLLALLAAYRSGLIKVTQNFRLGVVAATGGIFLVYLASWILGMFGIDMPFLHDSGPLGIGISLVIVAVAALNLVLDFDFIEQGAEHGAPRYMEWFAALGLMVTLVWLYIEILRLLSKLRE
jgi:Predicted membrane protein